MGHIIKIEKSHTRQAAGPQGIWDRVNRFICPSFLGSMSSLFSTLFILSRHLPSAQVHFNNFRSNRFFGSCQSAIDLNYDLANHAPTFIPAQIPDVPCVLLHGLLGSRRNLRSLTKLLPFKSYILPDLRNHGRSPQCSNMPMQSMASDVIRLLDQLEVEEASIIGHSMGEVI